MNYEYYLTKYWCKIFLKPNSASLKRFQTINVFKDNMVSGYFIDFNILSVNQIRYKGGKGTLYFVNRTEIKEFNENKDKQKYLIEISESDIISIEIIFDESKYPK
jgi:hypothetical protein